MAQATDGIKDSNLKRLTLQQQLAEANGFSLRPPLYALGTPVIELGQENFKKSRQEFDALPPASTVFAPFLNRVASEARKDVTVPVRDLQMIDDGRIVRREGDPSKTLYFDGARSLRSLLERTPCEEPGAAATYLATIPADRRAFEVNTWLEATEADKKAVLRTRLALAPPDDDVQTSTALALSPAPYGREVYAVVSERYGTGLEVDVIARAILSACERDILPGDARGEITYDGRKATIRALWHSNIDPRDACAGEVFKAGVSITAADDRSNGIEVDGMLWRNLCLNFIIIDECVQNFASRRHMGATRDLASWLFDALRAASRSVSGFAALWDGARAMALDSPAVTRDIPADKTRREITQGIFRGMLKTDRLALPGFRGEAAVGEFMRAFDREPEFCKVGIVNAVTRAAHESTLRGAFASEAVEAMGGAILSHKRPFQYVEVGEAF